MIDEYVSAVSRFADDLCALGIPQAHLSKVMGFYGIALFEPSDEAWTRLYRCVSELLQHSIGGTFESAAAGRLFALIDDDLGRRVLDTAVRTRLRGLLLPYPIAS